MRAARVVGHVGARLQGRSLTPCARPSAGCRPGFGPGVRRSGRTVPNVDSLARDHLANERTFLAWSRTGMAFVALGVAVDQVRKVRDDVDDESVAGAVGGRPPVRVARSISWADWAEHAPSVMTVGVGGMFLTYSTIRYYNVQRALLNGQFPVNRGGIAAVVASTALLTTAALALVFTGNPVLGRFLEVERSRALDGTRRERARTGSGQQDAEK